MVLRLWLQGSIGLSLPVVTRWGSVNRMMYSMVQNEAALKLVVSYPEFPGNPASRVSAVERTRGRDIKQTIEDPMYWEVVKGIKAFTQPPSDVRRPAVQTSRVAALQCLLDLWMQCCTSA